MRAWTRRHQKSSLQAEGRAEQEEGAGSGRVKQGRAAGPVEDESLLGRHALSRILVNISTGQEEGSPAWSWLGAFPRVCGGWAASVRRLGRQAAAQHE